MKKILTLFAVSVFFALNAQETANRFFYELTFKPKKDSAKLDKVMTILDVVKDKSIYRDYTLLAQDSILKIQVEAMQKAGTFKDISKSVTMPKFSEKIYKFYPGMKIQYGDRVANGFTPMNIGYNEDLKFDWKIQSGKEKIGAYNTQKATTEYGGRKWTAWFTPDIPLQDGPYKFYGLPGLIVKVTDDGNNYSWELKGNKKVDNFKEATYLESVQPGGDGGKVVEVSRDKFEKTFGEFKKDPMATARPYLTAEVMSQKIPGSDLTIGQMVKQQEKMMNDFFNANDNPIEISIEKSKK
ncbi:MULTISPECIES: GLPGLI family protein [unclassified Kaistella]|uniref:GLPGLI family protein n=1 Tax=unclassified Kaistella TaxID=2762626 RepID=UPI00273333C3|nr:MULTISPECIES: GLPGLI family protein [unclassified Kaistella]MDP2452910.1 GLPGLI family protein [Kaistella sp. SH11-4b]MDP2455819.1 GLPGLI family protein [Kaistella sp. SH40-3]MDP2458723.1 GLPGLI family protein [Kaistella sp. SH19-2b]